MSEPYYIEKGPVIIVPDPINPDFYQVKKNPEWSQIPEICSFGDFICWNYQEDYERVMRHCIENGLVPYGEHIDRYRNQIAAVHLNDTQIHRVYMHRINDVSFRIDTIVITSFTVHYTHGTAAKIRQWYRVQGTFHVCDKSDFFESVHIYQKNDIPQEGGLSDYLVPYLTKRNLDTEAEAMLHKYYPEALESPMKLNVRQLAENMGFQVKTARLSPDDSRLGSIYFEDTVITHYKGGTPQRSTVPAKTILIDMTAHKNRNRNPDDTVVHECIHAYEHYFFYYTQSMYHSFLQENTPEFEDMAVGKSEDDPLCWIEYQAVHMTPRVRMPLNQTTTKAEELFRKYEKMPESIALEHVTSDLAEFYGVSKETARNRLVELGYDKARGIGHFANGKPVPGYLVGKNVHYNQTYTIDFEKITEEYIRNEEFRKVLEKGTYIYVEGHLCRNNDKYIWYRNGQPCLSPYARTHMEECCLLFTIRHERQNYEYIPGILNSNTKRGELSYLYKEEYPDAVSEALAVQKIVTDMPEKFSETMVYHMHNLAMTKESLSERSLLSTRTISRMRNCTKKMPSLESIVAVSVGMNLLPELSDDLLQKADRNFDISVPEQLCYKVMLRTMYRETIYQWNEILEQRGFAPLKEDLLAAEA